MSTWWNAGPGELPNDPEWEPRQRNDFDERGDYRGSCGYALYGPPAICTCGRHDDSEGDDE